MSADPDINEALDMNLTRLGGMKNRKSGSHESASQSSLCFVRNYVNGESHLIEETGASGQERS